MTSRESEVARWTGSSSMRHHIIILAFGEPKSNSFSNAGIMIGTGANPAAGISTSTVKEWEDQVRLSLPPPSAEVLC